jgi:hypothetical protein
LLDIKMRHGRCPSCTSPKARCPRQSQNPDDYSYHYTIYKYSLI